MLTTFIKKLSEPCDTWKLGAFTHLHTYEDAAREKKAGAIKAQ